MGRRTENALLQGEDTASLERVVPAGPLPEPEQKKRAGTSDWTHAHTSGQLV